MTTEPTQPPATRAEPIDPELLHLAATAMVGAGRADQITVVHGVLVAVLPAHEAMVRNQVAEELRADADAHRRLAARKPSEHDEARLARARTLDEAAGRITRVAARKPSRCGSACPHHAHTCDRDPGHLGPHRDVQQKGDETCAWLLVALANDHAKRAEQAEAALAQHRAAVRRVRELITCDPMEVVHDHVCPDTVLVTDVLAALGLAVLVAKPTALDQPAKAEQ